MPQELIALSPRGIPPAIPPAPLAERSTTLNGKKILLIHSWAAGAGFEPLLQAVQAAIVARYPTAEVDITVKPTAYAIDDTDFWNLIVENYDSFVYAAAPSASTTHYAVHYTAQLERRGKPGLVLAYDTLRTDAVNSVSGSAVPVRWQVIPYPADQLAESTLVVFAQTVVQQLVEPLTDTERRAPAPAPDATHPEELHGNPDDLQASFHQHGWTDGLPVILPTPERVARMLAGTSHSPDTLLAEAMGPEGWQVSVQKAAVNAVMAGCQPSYLPVVLAALEAYNTAKNINAASFATCVRSTNSFSFMQAVNGPIRQELEMNSGLNALGPGNQANATIGRALRLAMINLGGVEIGKNAFPVQGNPAAYSFAFAENEEASPWTNFTTDRGYQPEENVLTLFTGGWSHAGNYIEGSITQLAKDVATFESPSGLLVLLSPQRARQLAAEGFSKSEVANHIWQNATQSAGKFRSDVYWKALIEPNIRLNDHRRLWPKSLLTVPDEEQIPVYPKEQIHIFVVGGEISPMMQAWKALPPVSVAIDPWR